MSRRNFQSHHQGKQGNRQGGFDRAPRHGPPIAVKDAGGDFVMGRNCLEEIVKHSPERLQEVFFAEGRDGGVGRGDRKGSLRESVESLGVPCRSVARRELDQLVQSDSHQGVVARVSPRRYLELDNLVRKVSEQDVVRIIALDGVVDPQNFGAILRAAECFGVSAVVWSKNRAAPLGPVVAKVSVGASELLPLCPVSNLHRAIEELKGAGVWSVGAVVSPEAMPLESFEFPPKCLLVMGSEGEGIQHLIEKSLDFQVYISMLGEISSLNVSQATSVMLHSMAMRHGQK